MDDETFRKMAIEILKEANKRKELYDKLGAKAYYTTKYCPAKTDTQYLQRMLNRVDGHNKRWEEEKCYAIQKSLHHLDKVERKRSRSSPKEAQYDDIHKKEKDYWKVEKALKFTNDGKEKGEIVKDLKIDKDNIYLFPTIASCASSDEEREPERESEREPEREPIHHHKHNRHHKHHSHHNKQ